VERFATILLGGAAAPAGLLERAAAAGARVVRSYGMTETVGGCVYDGIPLRDVEVAVSGPQGRIELRGPVLLHGYRARDAQGRLASWCPLDEEGWFATSDRGRLDDGRLEVLGRTDEVLVSGGENVPLAAVLQRLLTHPGVVDAAVVAVEDDRWGQVPAAVVVPSDPATPPALGDLRDHVRRQAPAAYAPAHLVVVAELPRDAMGKPSRERLLELVHRTQRA
jgi:o-succinylbenzoate---CoA ligase